MRGPIDYIIVGFEGNKFNGSIMRELTAAIDKEIISLVALAFISKDEDGNVTKLDITDLGDSYMIDFTQKYMPSSPDSITQEDIDELDDLLENNTSAGLLAIEHLWAKPLKKAIIDAGGVLIADGRIHPEAASELED